MKIVALIICGLLALVQGRRIDSNAVYKPRIVNGEAAEVGERPYQVSLQAFGRHFCGGSIINEYWIVTAAHCVVSKTADIVKVIAGTISLNEPYSFHPAAQITVHQRYDKQDSFRNDIALVEVVNPFQFSSRIQPVILPESHVAIETNSAVIVSGWGALSYPGVKPDKLQKATLYILDEKICQDYLNPNKIYPTHICAADPSTPRGDCHGDSGGPLTSNGVLTGIVSWSVKNDGCGSPRYPNVYTRVSEYVDWIYEHMKSINN